MSITIQCPHCGAKLRLKDDSALGKKIRCKKCEKAFVASEPDDGDDDDFLSDEGPVGAAPPPGLASVRRNKQQRAEKRKQTQAAASQGVKELPKWFMPAMIGTAVLVALGLLTGVGFLVRGALARTGGPSGVQAPTGWSNYRSPAEKFSCEYPSNWAMEASTSQGGGAMGWVRFTSGDAKINIRESMAGGALGDIAGATSDPNEQDESQTPVAKLHEFRKESVAEEYNDYQETAITTVQSSMGDARRSEYTAKFGFGSKLRGYRVTYISPRAQMNAMCECPEEDWETCRPIFERVILSVSP
jgi:predicted Zn finger-like uncharacterized protein